MKIVFFHMNQLGDLMFSLPVISAVRKAYPDAYLLSVLRYSHKDVVESLNIVDSTIIRPKKGVLKKLKLTGDIKRGKYDVGIFFSESPETLMMGYLGNVKRRIGFNGASLSFLLTDKVQRTGVPSLRNNNGLAEVLGINNVKPDYTDLLDVPEKYLRDTLKWIEFEGITKEKMLLLSPGASKRRKSKSWSRNSWAGLIDIASKNALVPVIIGAPGEEKSLRSIVGISKSKCRIFIPKRSILQTAALMKYSKVLVSIDSGAMHLAAALNLKSVALFASTDPSQVGPMPVEKHRIIRKESTKDIIVDDVWQAVSCYYS